MEPKERMRQLTMSSNVDVKHSLPVLRYYRAGPEMIRQAKVYLDEGKIESSYCIYLRYISLFLEQIQKHPDYNIVPKEDKNRVKGSIKRMMDVAENLKPLVEEKFKKEYDEFLKVKKKHEEEQKQREKEDSVVLPTIMPYQPPFSPLDDYSSLSGGLRTLIIPRSLIPKFLDLAKGNTQKNIETCGLLTGTLQGGQLTTTVLLIPQQSGSSDDCVAENDLATFNVIEQRGLLTLGWIHTHPSQKAFLSSVDLHSQFGYQLMMPEAVAIVCAPKFSNDILRLTDFGLDVIGACTKRGFHPHEGPILFETAGHVQINDAPCEVIDLRDTRNW